MSKKIIDIITPATSCTFDEIKKIKKFINNLGFEPRFFLEEKLLLKKPAKHEFPSFDATLRFEQFKKAIENEDSKIIWCARGGYGSADLLPFLYKMKKSKNVKTFVGFSDISSLNNFLIQEWNWQVVSAPMLAQIVLNKVSSKSIRAISDLILGKTKELNYQLSDLNSLTNNKEKAKTYQLKIAISNSSIAQNNIVVGGCVSVLASHFATKNQTNWQNKILFLEDEGEDGERLERYFRQIVDVIIEQKNYPQAILLGNFLEANPHGTPKAKNIQMAIEKLAQKLVENKLKIPLFIEKTKCLGHSKNMMPLVLGKKIIISAK